MQINIDKLFAFAKEVDASVVPNNLTPLEIDELIIEARQNRL